VLQAFRALARRMMEGHYQDKKTLLKDYECLSALKEDGKCCEESKETEETDKKPKPNPDFKSSVGEYLAKLLDKLAPEIWQRGLMLLARRILDDIRKVEK
jgi:hypothetical protein